MTARKFVVSKRGVQREVRRPKASARERLVEYMDLWMSIGRTCPKGRRLLRAHERELAERAGEMAAATLNEMEAELLMPGDADVERVWRVRLNAAILGTPRARKRGER